MQGINRTPDKRWEIQKKLVGAVNFLSSEASGFINEQIIYYVDGGILAAV